MTYSLLWLPECLKEAGLKVALVPTGGSRAGGREMGPVMGVIVPLTAWQSEGQHADARYF